VAIDKFTKWTEAVPTGEIKAANAIKFIKGIFCRYGLPHRIKIADGDGRELANSWNIDQLRKFYV
jgi:hypothetical protein